MKGDPPSGGARTGGEVLRGIAGAPGVAIGTAVVLERKRAPYPRRRIGPHEAAREKARFFEAVQRAQDDVRDVASRAADAPAPSHLTGSASELGIERSILDTYVMMIGDETLAAAVTKIIDGQGRCAEWAVVDACDALAARLAASGDPYLGERSHDVSFVGERIVRALLGETGRTLPALTQPSIVVAHDLSPADTASMVNEPVVGLVTEMGTRTSHTALMARALEIPAVVGVTGALSRIATGDVIVVDGLRGAVTIEPTAPELDGARARAARFREHARELSASREQAAETKDGARLFIRANVELPAEAILAREQGADGIGLYRTEFLYIDRAEPPSEDEQLEVFRAVVEAMRPRPVVLRTFDIGGDKFVSNFKLPPEMNPMLGLRAVRLALSRPGVFLTQLRAMVRASAYGDVRIMVPMVSRLDELRQVSALLREAIAEVRAAGHAVADSIPLGVMIEVPSAAIMAAAFAQEAAFLSLGTNDLIQYSLAVDRTSRTLAYLASPFEPAIIRLIDGVVRAGATCRRPVSICGAMATDPLAALLLLGLGVRDFSMEAAAIPEIKEVLRRATVAEAEAVASVALGCATASEVEHCVAEAFAPRLYDILTTE